MILVPLASNGAAAYVAPSVRTYQQCLTGTWEHATAAQIVPCPDWGNIESQEYIYTRHDALFKHGSQRGHRPPHPPTSDATAVPDTASSRLRILSSLPPSLSLKTRKTNRYPLRFLSSSLRSVPARSWRVYRTCSDYHGST